MKTDQVDAEPTPEPAPDPEPTPKPTPEPETPKPQPDPQVVITAPESPAVDRGPEPGSAEWIRVNLEIYKEMALDNPSDLDAVRAFALMDRMMNERSIQFADSFRTVQHTDPWLMLDFGAAGTRPNARLLANSQERREMRDIWMDASDEVGLVFFVQQECSYCDIFVGTLNRAATQRGLNVLAVDINGDPIKYPYFSEFYSPEMIQEFNVQTVPSVYLYNRNTQEHRLVTVGAFAETEFERRLTLMAYDMGALSKENYDRTQFTIRNNRNTVDDRLRDVLVDLRANGAVEPNDTNFISPSDMIQAVQEMQREERGQ